MSLLKRIGFWLFLILAIVAAAWAYLYLKKSKRPKVEAVSVLPDSCLVYLNTPDLFELNKKLNSQNLLVDKLKLFKDIGKFCGTMQTVDSVLSTNEAVRGEVENNMMHFALYRDLSWLFTFNIRQLGDQERVAEELAAVLHASKTENGYAFRLGLNRQLYFTLNAGVTLVSDSKDLIERALNTSYPKLYKNAGFAEFKSTLEENSPLNIYTNHRLYSKSKAARKLNLTALFTEGCSAGMIDLQPSQIAVNGFASCDSTQLLALLSNQEAAGTDFAEQLPAGVQSFTAYGFHDLFALQKRIKRQSPAVNSAFWRTINDSALFNVESEFYQNAGNCLVSIQIQFPKQDLVLLGINDTARALEHLQLMGDSAIQYNKTKVYHIKGLASQQLFSPLTNAPLRYIALSGNYLFFAENRAAVHQWLDDLEKGEVMLANKSFAAYKMQNFPEAFNLLVYAAPNLLKDQPQPFFNYSPEPGTQPFENFKHFSFCAVNHASNFKFRWHLLNEAETMNKDPNTLWTLELDQPAAVTTSLFKNHLTGENELVMQDEGNRLYLVNAKGTVLWKKQLTEKIRSQIFTVDIYKNKKYQMLFNTANYLHLVDRNGNEVQGYPVKLPAEASSELAVFDYDNDKNYRLFIACRNNNIYNYDISGLKQDGFSPVKTEAEVNLPVQYVRVGQSDYLVALDKEGKIYTFSRKGAGRIGLSNRAVANCQAFYVDATNNINSTYLIYADDKNSLINKVSFADKKEIVKLNSDINTAHVNFALVDENRSMDVIFTKPNSILASDFNGNVLFEKNPEAELAETRFYSDESHALFYNLNKEHSELLLIDQQNGTTSTYRATALPLICDLFNDNKKYLVISNGNRLYCVLL